MFETKASRRGTRRCDWMREIISMEIEKGVTIKLSDGTVIIGAKQIYSASDLEQKIVDFSEGTKIKTFL